MNPPRVAAVTRRIVAQFRHDRRTLALLFVAPVAIIGLLGWVLSGQQVVNSRIAIVNQAGPVGSAVETRLSSALASSSEVTVDSGITNIDSARQALKDGAVDLVIVLPSGFSAQAPTIQLLTLGMNPSAEASSIQPIQKAISTVIASTGAPVPNLERTTVYGSANQPTIDTFAPASVGFFVYFFVFILTGISFLRERVGGTLERLLATPVTRGEIVVGYSLGFGIFATLQVAIVLLFTIGRFQIPALGPVPAFAIGLGVRTAGSPLIAYVIALLLGLGSVSLGIFISTFARTEFQILQFIPLVVVPQALLGGLIWPIDQLPTVLQPLARVMPVTYAIDGLRQVMIAGNGLASAAVQLDLVVLAAIAAVFIALASATIRREVA